MKYYRVNATRSVLDWASGASIDVARKGCVFIRVPGEFEDEVYLRCVCPTGCYQGGAVMHATSKQPPYDPGDFLSEIDSLD